MAIAKKPFKIDGVAIPTPTEYKDDMAIEMEV